MIILTQQASASKEGSDFVSGARNLMLLQNGRIYGSPHVTWPGHFDCCSCSWYESSALPAIIAKRWRHRQRWWRCCCFCVLLVLAALAVMVMVVMVVVAAVLVVAAAMVVVVVVMVLEVLIVMVICCDDISLS